MDYRKVGSEVLKNVGGQYQVIIENKVANMNFNPAFIGRMGIHPAGKYTTASSMDGKLKAAVITAAEQCYVVADHSKINIRQFYTYGQFEGVTLITDEMMPFTDEHLKVIYVSGEK